MNWLGRGHEGVGVRGAAEGEAGQRHAPDRALLDRPGDGLRRGPPPAGCAGTIAEMPKPRLAVWPARELHRRAAGDELLDPVLGQREARPGPHDLARDRRVVGRLGGLLLLGIDHDEVDQMPGHPHVVRPQRPRRGHALHLRDDQPAVVAHRDRLVEPAEIGALVLVGEVAALVRRGGAQDRHVRHDVGEVEPGLAAELDARDDRPGGGGGVHGAAFADRVGEGVEPDPGQHARPARRDVAVHVEEDARGHVVGRDLVLDHHAPDLGHRQRRGPARVGARDDGREQALLGDVVHALDPVHVARGDRDGAWSARADGPPRSNRAPIAASTLSGQPSPEEEDTDTTAPSGIARRRRVRRDELRGHRLRTPRSRRARPGRARRPRAPPAPPRATSPRRRRPPPAAPRRRRRRRSSASERP